MLIEEPLVPAHQRLRVVLKDAVQLGQGRVDVPDRVHVDAYDIGRLTVALQVLDILLYDVR